MEEKPASDVHLPEGQLWFGILGPPIVWAIQMQTNYSLVPFECFGGSRAPMFAVSTLAFFISAAAGLIAFKNWRRFGADWPDDASGSARALFMAALGLLVSAMFSLTIAAQAIATMMLHPCIL
jgi:Co/Zn/Cd efflux system component